jgi:hypothetical protein
VAAEWPTGDRTFVLRSGSNVPGITHVHRSRPLRIARGLIHRVRPRYESGGCYRPFAVVTMPENTSSPAPRSFRRAGWVGGTRDVGLHVHRFGQLGRELLAFGHGQHGADDDRGAEFGRRWRRRQRRSSRREASRVTQPLAGRGRRPVRGRSARSGIAAGGGVGLRCSGSVVGWSVLAAMRVGRRVR